MKILFLAPSNSIHSHKWINCFVKMKHQVAWFSMSTEGAPKSADIFFTSVAKEVLDTFEKNDAILLSDILEHDLTSGLDQWHSLLFDEEAVRTFAKV